MCKAYVNARILNTDENYKAEWLSGFAVVVAGGLVRELVPEDSLPADVQILLDVGGNYLVPGFIDTQVNGGGGVLLNDAPTVESLVTIAEAHRRFGTCGMFPTLISDDFQVMRNAISAVEKAIAQNVRGILGIHLEGPFLNSERKGVHDAEKFRVIDDEAIELLCSLKLGKTLVTLAPEMTNAAQIKRLCDAGVVVSAGHTAANYNQTRAALNAGLSSFTHLFNAMTPMTSREPGVVGAALEDKNSWCGIIVDNFHVHPATLKTAIAAKAKGKMVLVTDAMSTVGSDLKSFQLNGETIHARDGRLATENGTLAGSDLDMMSAVRNSVELLGLSLAEAVKMASAYPAAMMGLGAKYGKIEAGFVADFVSIDSNLQLLEVY